MVHQPDLELRWGQIKNSLVNPLFILIFLLMLLNWGMETLKWTILITPIEKISFFKAFKSVLAGCSITMLTPNRTGEFGGRILFIKPENRIRGAAAAIFGSISQLLITLLIGTLALLYFKFYDIHESQTEKLSWIFNDIVYYSSLFFSVILMIFYFRIHFLTLLLNRFPIIKKLARYVDIVESYDRKDLLRILIYSFIRYSIFILQFALMLIVMNVGIGFMLTILLLAVFYLMMAILPTIGFTELPVRATASVVILGLFSDNVLGIGAAAFGIWVVNLVIPSLLGGIFIIGTKIIREK